MNAAATLPIAEDQGQAFWRAAEAAQAVHDRYQFFVWLRLHLHRFVPHDLALCLFRGFEGVQLFYSVPLSRPLLDALPQGRSSFWRGLHDRWAAQGGRAMVLPLDDTPAGTAPPPEWAALRADGFDALAVHGLGERSRIRPEALFAFALRGPREEARTAASHLELWLPTLYCTAMRAIAPAPVAVAADWRSRRAADDEREDAADEAPAGGHGALTPLTGRELQILAAVRDAKRNAQIGEQLGISPLTVKNHLRKIMRKLNAGNRAQAVAEAMARRLIA